jgi:SAM-dependent methyltransferase
MNKDARVSEFSATYDALAPRWDAWAAAVTPPFREDALRRLPEFVADGERVVELGCGTGVPVGQALAARYDYTGVDASAGMLERARAAVPSGTFVHADMETTSFPAASLGAVVAFFSIIHVPRERHTALFAAIAEWLRAGGVFLGTLHSADDPDDYAPNWLDAGPMRWSGYDAVTNRALLERAGFEVLDATVIEQVEPDGCVIHPLLVFARTPT